MGTLSTLHKRHRMGHKRPPNRDPLRAVVELVLRELTSGVKTMYQKLECGHELLPRQDIIGQVPTPKRRRCWRCGEEEKKAMANTAVKKKLVQLGVKDLALPRFKDPDERLEQALCTLADFEGPIKRALRERGHYDVDLGHVCDALRFIVDDD